MASRRKARELALQMLFQWEVGSHEPADVLRNTLQTKKLNPEVEAFAKDLFVGAVAEVETLDRTIGRHSKHWRVARMPAVDRNVLRIALFELMHRPETPPAVVINEALEIARIYSSEDSVEFINGVLDNIRQSLTEAKPS